MHSAAGASGETPRRWGTDRGVLRGEGVLNQLYLDAIDGGLAPRWHAESCDLRAPWERLVNARANTPRRAKTPPFKEHTHTANCNYDCSSLAA